MNHSVRQRSELFWMLGVAGSAALASLAWHQVHVALAHCLWIF